MDDTPGNSEASVESSVGDSASSVGSKKSCKKKKTCTKKDRLSADASAVADQALKNALTTATQDSGSQHQQFLKKSSVLTEQSNVLVDSAVENAIATAADECTKNCTRSSRTLSMDASMIADNAIKGAKDGYKTNSQTSKDKTPAIPEDRETSGLNDNEQIISVIACSIVESSEGISGACAAVEIRGVNLFGDNEGPLDGSYPEGKQSQEEPLAPLEEQNEADPAITDIEDIQGPDEWGTSCATLTSGVENQDGPNALLEGQNEAAPASISNGDIQGPVEADLSTVTMTSGVESARILVSVVGDEGDPEESGITPSYINEHVIPMESKSAMNQNIMRRDPGSLDIDTYDPTKSTQKLEEQAEIQYERRRNGSDGVRTILHAAASTEDAKTLMEGQANQIVDVALDGIVAGRIEAISEASEKLNASVPASGGLPPEVRDQILGMLSDIANQIEQLRRELQM